MTIKELGTLTFHEAVEKLSEELDNITSVETLKEFAIAKIKDDHIFLALHVLEAINSNYADYYDYDYNMGTLESPTPLSCIEDLQDYCDFDEPDNTYKVMAHIHTLDGKMAEVTVLGERQEGTMTVYIVDYNGTKCTAIFNPFVCEYYADDKYGIIKEN
jgi:hypothetical protein